MSTHAHDKYYLKSLHEEIDLFDRKLAHLLKYDTFANEADRKASANKMSAKRELLARTARQLASEGIEFNPSDLPRSFRTDDMTAPVKTDEVLAEKAGSAEAHVASPLRAVARQFPSPFAGTSLDGQVHMEAYKRGRGKAAAPDA